MKTYCFHPPKNIIVGTLAAILWVAVFPFWLLGESTPLNALVSGEVPLWDTLTCLTMQDYSNITRAKWDGMLIFTMLTLLLTIPTLFCREKRRKLPLMMMLLFLLWTGLSCFFGSHAGEMNVWDVPTVLWGSGRYEGFVTIACYVLIFLCLRRMAVNIPALLTVCSAPRRAIFSSCCCNTRASIPCRFFRWAGASAQTTNFRGQSAISTLSVRGSAC